MNWNGMTEMRHLSREAVRALQAELQKHQEIVLLIHHNPDGDALGSALALSMYLEQKGHQCCIISPNDFPDFLQWMPGIGKVRLAHKETDFCTRKIREAGFLFCLDLNQSKRVSLLQTALEQSKAYKALIDHHIDPSDIFDFTYSVTEETSSTCELVYRLIACHFNDADKITKEMAECLYTGIVTDTGSFSYHCDNVSTFETAGKLMELHINGEQIHRNIYDTYSESRVRLLGFCLSERMVVLDDYATSYIYLTKEDLQRFHFKQGDTEGIVNYGLSMKSVHFTAFFTERDGHIRISFRSKADFDVNAYARAHFNGGGHRNAAGGEFHESMEKAIALFRSTLDQYKNQLLP